MMAERRFSLGQQIDEVDYELRQRNDVYPRLVGRGTLRPSEAEYHVARMQAVRETLLWLDRHEADVRAFVAARAAAVAGSPATEAGE